MFGVNDIIRTHTFMMDGRMVLCKVVPSIVVFPIPEDVEDDVFHPMIIHVPML